MVVEQGLVSSPRMAVALELVSTQLPGPVRIHETVVELGQVSIQWLVVAPELVSTQIEFALELDRTRQIAAEQGQASIAS